MNETTFVPAIHTILAILTPLAHQGYLERDATIRRRFGSAPLKLAYEGLRQHQPAALPYPYLGAYPEQ